MSCRLGALAACLMALLACVLAAADVSAAPNGLVVSPAIEQLALAPGQDSASFTATVTNDSPSVVTVVASVDDFTAQDASGTALFLNNTAKVATSHGLAHWMTPGLATVTLQPQASITMPITIADALAMAPGGHYGAVIFQQVPTITSGHTNSFNASASVSLLVFLTTSTPGTQAISLATPDVSKFYLAMPDSINLLFANTGDTQTTPRGTVVVSDRAGKEVAKGIINVDSGQVLPGTNRLYQVRLIPERGFFWPGVYHLTVSYRPDGQATAKVFSQSFLLVNAPIVIVGSLLLVAGAGLVLRRVGPVSSVRVRRR